MDATYWILATLLLCINFPVFVIIYANLSFDNKGWVRFIGLCVVFLKLLSHIDAIITLIYTTLISGEIDRENYYLLGLVVFEGIVFAFLYSYYQLFKN